MTNQMKKLLKLSVALSFLSLVVMIIALISGGFGYENVFSYVLLGVNILLFITLICFYIIIEYRDYHYRKKILRAKNLLILRDNAVLGFYKKYNLKPQYNEKGQLITPDELLQIVIQKTEDGTPIKTIYELLGIEPVLDENGKEVPVILVLKHLIKKIRTENVKDIKKLQGLYLKGSKKEKKKEEKKPTAKQAKKASSGEKSKGSKPKQFPFDLVEKKGEKKSKSKDKKKEQPKEQKKEEQKPEKKVEPIKQEEIKQEKAKEEPKTYTPPKKSYYERMFTGGNVNNNKNSSPEKEDSGEFTLE